jgi:hypothetical protein
MSFSITYKTLFEISILHGYFLNSGETLYDDLDTDKRKKISKDYSFEDFIEIVPTYETSVLLKNNHILINKKAETFKVGIKISEDDPNLTFANVSTDLTLNFIIRIKDFLLENYTDGIEFTSNQIIYFSNKKPDSEPNTFKYIPLFDDVVFIDDDYKILEETTTTLLDSLYDYEKTGIFGIISLKMQGDNDNLNIMTDDKEIIVPTPKFKIHFNNRKTFWKYNKTGTSFNVETSLAMPLTKHGFVEINPLTDFTTNPPEASDFQYPNPSVLSIRKIASKIYSEIFI